MNHLHPLRACVVLLACLCGAAPVAAQTTLGRVIGVYVEVAPGVHAERSTTFEDPRPQIAEVRLAGSEGTPARTLMVRAGDLALVPGDTVEINLGERGMLTGVRATAPYVMRMGPSNGIDLVQRAATITDSDRGYLPR